MRGALKAYILVIYEDRNRISSGGTQCVRLDKATDPRHHMSSQREALHPKVPSSNIASFSASDSVSYTTISSQTHHLSPGVGEVISLFANSDSCLLPITQRLPTISPASIPWERSMDQYGLLTSNWLSKRLLPYHVHIKMGFSRFSLCLLHEPSLNKTLSYFMHVLSEAKHLLK